MTLHSAHNPVLQPKVAGTLLLPKYPRYPSRRCLGEVDLAIWLPLCESSGVTCAVCSSPARSALEAAVIRGLDRDSRETLQTLCQAEFCAVVTPAQLRKHERSCMASLLSVAAPVEERRARVDVLASAVEVMQEARRLGAAAEEAKDLKTALQGLDRVMRAVELISKMQGDSSEGPPLDRDPRFVLIRDAIFTALELHPAAKQAVVDALRRL